MPKRLRSKWLCLAFAAALAGPLAVQADTALAQVSQDQAAARIAEEYGVEVLRVRPGEIDGKPVWLVTVMKPGGAYNTAFQVSTLAVDQASGDLVPAFRQGSSGAVGNATPRGTRIDRRPDASRSGTWR